MSGTVALLPSICLHGVHREDFNFTVHSTVKQRFQRQEYVLRKASLGDFVIVRTS